MGGIPSCIKNSDKYSIIHASELTKLLQVNRQDINSLFPEEMASPCSTEDDIVNLVLQFPHVLDLLNLLCGYTRIKETISPVAIGDDPLQYVETVVVDTANELEDIVKEFKSSHAIGCSKYAIIAECAGLSDLSVLRTVLPGDADLVGLSVPNNQLTDCNLTDFRAQLKSSSLSYLNVGGNSLLTVWVLVAALPPSMHTLDLSFTDNLFLDRGVFVCCPQLRQLSLDGCGLISTVHSDNSYDITGGEEAGDPVAGTALLKACQSSIFYGLICLVRLSLKENALEEPSDLEGLRYFSAQAAHSLSSFNDIEADCESKQPRLLHLDIAENPLCEVGAKLSCVRQFAVSCVPSLLNIDNFTVNSSQSAAVNMTSLMATKHELDTDGGMMSESMEKEFLAALKGQRDDTIIS